MSTVSPTIEPTLSDTDDENRLAHIGRKDDVTRGYLTGCEITALCGVKFVPTRDPNNYPKCPRCTAILDGIKAGRTGSN